MRLFFPTAILGNTYCNTTAAKTQTLAVKEGEACALEHHANSRDSELGESPTTPFLRSVQGFQHHIHEEAWQS